MKRGFQYLIWMFLFSSPLCAKDFLLPHVADGRFAGGIIRMTVIYLNPTTDVVTAELILTRDDGSPLQVTISGLGPGSRFTLTLQPGETRILQTDGSGALAAGAARITANGDIGVSGVFTIFDVNGKFLTEAGITSSEPLTEFVIPVDTTGSFNTGLALFAFSGSTSVSFTLRDTFGLERTSTSRNFSSGEHWARFVAGDIFPAISNFRGTLVVRSSSPVAALVLRQNASPLSFTTLVVVSRSSTQLNFNLAHIADGTFAGGRITTTFLIFSLSTSTGTVNLTLTKEDGSPFALTLPGAGTNSSFSLVLSPGGSLFLQTAALGPLAAGAAVVSANVPIGVLAIFTIFDNQGRFVTEAGIADSPLLSQFTLPVEVTSDFSTGVAFFIPGATSVDLTIRQLDANGVLVRTADTVTLGGKRKIARFAADFFQGLTSFRGSFSITASGPVAILILRQNAVPLSFTTLQAAPGAVAGAPDLSISKTDAGASFTVGSNGSYTIAVRNAGSRPTTGKITVSDSLPTGLSFVSATGTGWSCSVSGQIVTCAHSGPFAANATSNIALTVAVASGAIPSVTNTASVSTSGDPNAANNSSSDSTTIVANADLVVTQTGPASCSISGSSCPPVTYTVTIKNNGPHPATAVVLRNTLPVDPAGSGATISTLVSATPSQGSPCTQSSGVVTCNLGTLNSGSSATVALQVEIDASAQARNVTNAANATSTSVDPNPGNNSSNFTHPVTPTNIQSDIELTLSRSPASVPTFTDVTYIASIINKGPSSAFGVSFTLTFPSNTTVISRTFTGSGGVSGSCSGSNTNVICGLGTMIRNASRTVTVKARFSTTGTKSSTGTVSIQTTDPTTGKTQTDPDSSDNSVTVTTTVN